MAQHPMVTHVRDVFAMMAKLMRELVPNVRLTVIVTLSEKGTTHSTLFSQEPTDNVVPTLKRMTYIVEEQGDERSRIIKPGPPEAG